MRRLRIYVDFSGPADALELLKAGTQGHELVFAHQPGASVLGKAAEDPQMAEVDVAFGQPDTKAIAAARQLQWVQISSSGITRYDTPEFRQLLAQRHIALCNSATVYREACAVHVLSFMLAQARHLPLALESRAAAGSAAWNELRNACRTLRGETVLIVGYGAIGQRLAELLRPFGVNLLAYRRRRQPDSEVPFVAEGELLSALGRSDHVVNILPESAATRHFFDHARLGAIRRGATFYNIGRGATVDQEALLEALRSHHLAAAWLDVTEPEPLPEQHPLRAQPNCFITPHVAGGHAEESKTLVRHFLDNLGRFSRGEPLLDRVM